MQTFLFWEVSILEIVFRQLNLFFVLLMFWLFHSSEKKKKKEKKWNLVFLRKTQNATYTYTQKGSLTEPIYLNSTMYFKYLKYFKVLFQQYVDLVLCISKNVRPWQKKKKKNVYLM